MSAEPFDIESVIAGLEARRTAYNTATDEAVAALRRLVSLAGLPGGAGAFPHSISQTTPGNPDEYYGLSLAEAAKKYLRSVRRKLTNKEIADGLNTVGYIHNSKDLANNVGTALWRAESQDDPDLVRHGRYWLLTEWGVRKKQKKAGAFSEIPTPDQIEAVEEIDGVKEIERELAKDD